MKTGITVLCIMVLLLTTVAMAQAPSFVNNPNVVVTATVTDPVAPDGTPGSGVAKVRISFDNGTTWTAWESFPAQASWTGDFSGKLVDGQNTILFEAADSAGNVAQMSKEVSVDTNPPVIQLTVKVSSGG